MLKLSSSHLCNFIMAEDGDVNHLGRLESTTVFTWQPCSANYILFRDCHLSLLSSMFPRTIIFPGFPVLVSPCEVARKLEDTPKTNK